MDGTFHVAMFPWLAIGHMTPFLHLANELAARGHRISFYLPKKALSLLQRHNSHPDLITFRMIEAPHVNGLPPGTETTSGIPISATLLLVTALDLTRDQLDWTPPYWRQGPTSCSTMLLTGSRWSRGRLASSPSVTGLSRHAQLRLRMSRHVKWSQRTVVLRGGEAHSLQFVSMSLGEGITFYERTTAAMRDTDVIAMRTCRELEGNFSDYISEQYSKPVFLTGPVLPNPSTSETLEEQWTSSLSQFQPGSVVFCAFRSQYILEMDQFQKLLLGIEVTKRPFLISLKPPNGAASVEEALPPGFKERTMGRGTVTGGWVPQPQILQHKSAGCFVSHCRFGSMWESLMCESQLVLVPHLGDQILNARLLAEELRVAVEVGRAENGSFSRESPRKAIESVMDPNVDAGKTVRENHTRWREMLTAPDFMTGYVDKFIHKLRTILHPA